MGLFEMLNSFAFSMERKTKENLYEQAKNYSGSNEDKESYNRAQEMYEQATNFSSALGRNVEGREAFADSMHSRAIYNITPAPKQKNRF